MAWEALSATLAVERAHRMPARPPPQASPCTFISKSLNYKDQDAAVRLAREKGNIPHGNGRVAIFPDFSADVQRRRQSFMKVKRRLPIKHLKYSMPFPAKLQVAWLGIDDRMTEPTFSRILRRLLPGWNVEKLWEVQRTDHHVYPTRFPSL